MPVCFIVSRQMEVCNVMKSLPTGSMFLRAIELYVKIAYKGPPPSAVRCRIDTLRSMPEVDFYTSTVLERDDPRYPHRFCLRLGNQTYPHMKLVLLRQETEGFAFGVEEHDHLTTTPTPGSRDWRFFQQMIAHNKELAEKIEAAWRQEHLPVLPRVPGATRLLVVPIKIYHSVPANSRQTAV